MPRARMSSNVQQLLRPIASHAPEARSQGRGTLGSHRPLPICLPLRTLSMAGRLPGHAGRRKQHPNGSTLSW